MKKYVLSLAIVSALLFVTTNIQAQSWADLFKKENIEKVVNAVTGNFYFQCGQHFYKHRRKTHDERNVFL